MAIGARNENEGVIINTLFPHLGRLRKNPKTHTLPIYYTGKQQELRAQGHGSLQAALDTELQLIPNKGIS